MKEDLRNDDARGERLAPAIFAVLEQHRFFELLEVLVYPHGQVAAGEDVAPDCDRTFRHVQSLIEAFGFDDRRRADVLTVLRARDGFCDCGVLLNVEASVHPAASSRGAAADNEAMQ